MSSNAALGAIGCALTLVVGGSTVACAAASRDWTRNPAIVQMDTADDQEIYAIGDPHGDWQRLAMVLNAAGLIGGLPEMPSQVKWKGSRSVLVITGDLIDKGPDSIGVITLVRALQADAATQGGRVIITMGNHEAEFLANPGEHKVKEFRKELDEAHLDPQKVGACDGEIGQFLCALPIAVRVNDWFFSHGGNTDKRTIDQLEAAIEAGAKDSFDTPELVGDNSILEARLNSQGPNHLAWFYDGDRATDPQALLADYAAALKTTEPAVKHLVQGHQYGDVKFPHWTRENGHFFQSYGLLFLIDTGMSSGIDDSNNSGGGALRIKGTGSDQEAVVICANGTDTKPLWNAKDAPDHADEFCSR